MDYQYSALFNLSFDFYFIAVYCLMALLKPDIYTEDGKKDKGL
jgi:hypothetical protein